MDLVIEAKAGTKRRGYYKRIDYGYIKNTLGSDGDEVDVYVGTHYDSPLVFVVDQMTGPDFTEFDEQKCFVYFQDEQQVRDEYLAQYDDDPRRLGCIRAVHITSFLHQLEANPGQIIKALMVNPISAKIKVISSEESMNKNLKEAINVLDGVTSIVKGLSSKKETAAPEEKVEKALTSMHVPRVALSEHRSLAAVDMENSRIGTVRTRNAGEPPVVPVRSIAAQPLRSSDPRGTGVTYKSCGACGTMHKSLAECPRCEYTTRTAPTKLSAIED